MTKEQREAVKTLRSFVDTVANDCPPTEFGNALRTILAMLTPPDEDHRAVVVWVPRQCDDCRFCDRWDYTAVCWYMDSSLPGGRKCPGCPWYEEDQP